MCELCRLEVNVDDLVEHVDEMHTPKEDTPRPDAGPPPP